jgi:hypothetical protein
MQGNCAHEPPSAVALQLSGAELLARKPGQCLLVVSGDTLDVASGNAWLDNLYLRVRSTGADADPAVLTVHQVAQLWMTNVTIQGDGGTGSQALVATDARGVYADSCVFDSVGGTQSALRTQATPLAFSACRFTNNLQGGVGKRVAVVDTARAPVLLRSCDITSNHGALLRSSNGALVFSDDATLRCAPLLCGQQHHSRPRAIRALCLDVAMHRP